MPKKMQNIKGNKYGRWLVLERGPSGNWKCRCDCGTERYVKNSDLIKGRSKSCGCLQREIVSKMFSEDIENKRFGRLVAICRKGVITDGVQWLCQCDCGNETLVSVHRLKSGNTKSCGCLKDDFIRAKGENAKKHYINNKKEYKAWTHIKQRCYNPNTEFYEYYGGRGITVCDRWLESFENFYEDMGDAPKDNGVRYTIERIDVDGDYCKENCKWATDKEQARNRTNNALFILNEVENCIAEWCDILGIKRSTIDSRINKHKWTFEQAIGLEPRNGKFYKAPNLDKFLEVNNP